MSKLHDKQAALKLALGQFQAKSLRAVCEGDLNILAPTKAIA